MRLSALIEYAESGWHLFPLAKGTAIPEKNIYWQDLSTTDPSKIEEWFDRYENCNWGVDCGKSGLLVVDIDVKKGKDGLNSIKKFGQLPNTFTVRTPTGGMHLYYTGEGRTSAGSLGEGLDTRGVGGYVAIPGSRRPEGKYKILRDVRETNIPSVIADALKQVGHEAKTASVELDIPSAIARAMSYLKEGAESAIEGDSGDEQTYKVAVSVKDMGISEEMCLELMLDHYNDRCNPPWSEGELETKVANAYKYGQNDAGCWSAQAIFEPLTDPDFRLLRADEFDIEDVPKRQWILGRRYVRKFVTVTVSAGGSGKSTLSFLELASIASGMSLTGDVVYGKSNVLMYNTEDPLDEMKRRMAAMFIHNNMADDVNSRSRIYYQSGVDQPLILASKNGTNQVVINHKVINSLVKSIKRFEIGLLCIDPFVDCHSLDENKNSEVNVVIKILCKIAQDTNCAVALVHHTRKRSTNQKDNGGDVDMSRGANAVSNAARIVHTLTNMSDREARKFGIPESESWRYVKLKDAKANMAPVNKTDKWFKKVSVRLANGEDVGCIEPVELTAKNADPEAELLKAVKECIDIGEELSISRLATRIRQADILVDSPTESKIKTAIKDLLESEVVCEDMVIMMFKDGKTYKVKGGKYE